ncbi:EID1-like F-box protein 2 [Populus alba x Populus x berolinensis]|nr:EID1-like F-box protein 2 [Populus alba x Populus x berolinensis]
MPKRHTDSGHQSNNKYAVKKSTPDTWKNVGALESFSCGHLKKAVCSLCLSLQSLHFLYSPYSSLWSALFLTLDRNTSQGVYVHVETMILTKQYRCVHSSSCQCIKGHLSEDVIFLVFQQLNWNPKLIATLSCVCKWFDDLAKRVLWKAFCRARAPKMMLDLQSSGSHSVDGNWRALGKLLIYCSGCTKGGLFNNVHIPGHFVYRTRFSRTSGKSFLLPQCRTDVLYVSDPCEHLDQGDEGDVGFFRGIFKSFSMSKVRKMLIKRGAQLHPTEVCPYCKAKLWSMQQAEMIPQSASCRLGAYDDCIEYYVCLNGHVLGICTLLPLSDSEEVSELE